MAGSAGKVAGSAVEEGADSSPQWLWPLGPNLVLAAVSMAVFCWLAFQRFPHPFQLEWMEGGSLQHLLRLLEGRPLYPAPTIDFVPFPYPPFYYYAALPFTEILGADFRSLRLVSILSAVTVAILIHRFVRFETGRSDFGLISAGLFAATYRASGAYMDVARLDSLYLALALGAAYGLRVREDRRGLLFAGGLAFLAAMTKQTALVLLGPLYAWCVFWDLRAPIVGGERWRRTVFFAAASLFAITVAVLLINRGENTHFLFYILGAQSGHEIRWAMLPSFFWNDLFLTLPVATGAMLLWWVKKPNLKVATFYQALFLGILVSCLVPRIKVGGAMNNLIPLHAGLALIGTIAVASLLEAWRRGGGRASSWIPVLVSLGLVLQFLGLYFDPRIALPRPRDVAAGERILKRLESIDGDILMPAQSYLPGFAGARTYAHQMPVDDLGRSGLAGADTLAESFAVAIRNRDFEIIIDSTSRFLEYYPNDQVLRNHYQKAGPVFNTPGVLIPRSGWQVSPGMVWVPRVEGPGVTGSKPKDAR